MKNTRRTLIMTTALVLGGSVSVAAQQALPERVAAIRGSATGEVAADRAPLAFWEAVNDTTLRRLIREAMGRNHEVQVADARVHGARAARLSSALDLTPAITATGGYTRQRMSSLAMPGAIGSFPDQELWDAGLRLSWEVDVFGRGRRALQGQGELVAASSENVRDVKVTLAGEIAAAYFELRGAQDRLAVAQRNAENQRGTLDLTLQRLEGGRGTALDTERARAQLSGTLADIPMLEAAIASARYRLGVLTTRAPETLAAELGAAGASVALPAELVVPSAQAIVLRRPDVRSAERQAAARAAFVGAARAEYLPRVAIGGGAGYTS